MLVERAMPNSLVGQKVLELEIKGARISAVRRLGSAVIPDAKSVVQQGDVCYFAVEKDSIKDLDSFLKKGSS